MSPARAGDWTEAVMQRVDQRADNECWPWLGVVRDAGYGTFSRRVDGRVTSAPAHRLVYELLVGPIPPGLQLDHTCHDAEICGGPCEHRRCCNPAHLEAVSPAENARRSAPAIRRSSPNRAKTHCPQGHAYEGDNLIETNGHRYCRTCRDLRNRKRKRSESDLQVSSRRRRSAREDLLLFLRTYGNSNAPSNEPAFVSRRGRPRKTVCKWGHPLIDPNLVHMADGTTRRCKACQLHLPSMQDLLSAFVVDPSTGRIADIPSVEGSTRTAGGVFPSRARRSLAVRTAMSA